MAAGCLRLMKCLAAKGPLTDTELFLGPCCSCFPLPAVPPAPSQQAQQLTKQASAPAGSAAQPAAANGSRRSSSDTGSGSSDTSTVPSNNSFAKGDAVQYLDRDGAWQPAKVCPTRLQLL